MRLPEQPERAGGENIIPLINIVFLLLIFFLLAGTLAPRPPFELEPVETAARPPSDGASAALYISASGDLYYRNQLIELEELRAAAAGHAPGPAPLRVMLDRRLKAEALFPVMEALTRAGVEKVRLVTERGEAK